MSKARSPSDVHKALVDKGMTPNENHHHMLRKELDGVVTLVTRISHGAKDINDTLGVLMGHQTCLRLKEFWDLVDCTMSEADWDLLVRERCSGGRNPFLR